ncbi:MAG: anion permease [Bacteroidaceae bacterium]|jgi:di/tricarboxylate transporter|nr:anion permease [Bacteroidaceae bacterium]MBQ1633583.1 anion permease [Bacteroidaceae bacterium]MBQ2185497.1 anion permease [Bacteroidaceae bacterium]MBQ6051457.1 anion permease [Bacteroidaceae bacterium]
MSFGVIYVAVILLLMLFALMREMLRPGLVLFTAVVLLLCAGIINPEEALKGFSNKGMITVALLYLVSEGVRKSGILEQIVFRMLPTKNVSITKTGLRFYPIVSFISAFFNNTPVVVIFAPMIKNWAKKMKLPPTKFLIPLSYATVIGGICTLIGTTTNLVLHGMLIQEHKDEMTAFEESAGQVKGILLQNNIDGMHMFELTKVGIFIALAGLIYLIFFSKYLLPDNRQSEEDTEDDKLTPEMNRYEILLSNRFPGLGKTLHTFDFYRHYGAHVRAIRRGGTIVSGDYMNTPLTHEDTLIVDAEEDFMKTWGDSRVFWMINRMGEYEPPLGHKKRWLAVVLLVLMIIGATVGELPIVTDHFKFLKLDMFFFACVTTIIMAWTKMFNPRKYTKFFSWDVLITIACAFAISAAMTKSGFADFVAGYIISLTDAVGGSSYGVYIILAALFLITNIFTELITNNAAAALAFPLALAVSEKLGVNPMPFVVCVCFAASSSFSTPIGYQTNLIVQGVGGYKFKDFARVGIPMNIIVFLVSVLLIPIFYHLV